MKKYFILLLVFAILTVPGTAFAASKDVPSTASYYSAVERVTSLGLMDNTGSNTFQPAANTTREQFAKSAAIAAGLGDSADLTNGTSPFFDLAANGEYNGYINLCLSKGYMSGMTDGNFHPKDAVTFSQAVTAMVRILGYTDSDLKGIWPKNYLEKAKALGITSGLDFASDSKVPRGAMAQMLDRLLDTNIRKSAPSDADKTLAEASELTVGTMYTNYSKPVVFYKANVSKSKLDGIDLSGSLSIVRNSVDHSTNPVTVTNGEAIKASDIQDFNVVYQVSDKTGKNKYVLVIDNKVTGTLEGILPNKNTPQQILVDGTTYDLDKYFNITKLNGANSFSIDDGVTLLLGYDGKVVDIQEALYSDNTSFAFVKNYTSLKTNDKANYGIQVYTVKLLMSNGSVNTFDCSNDPSEFKGKLVIFTKQSNGSVTLKGLNYSTPGEVTIRKDDKQILSNYDNAINTIAGNIKIFNYISNEDEVDAQAEILSWSDLPAGKVKSGDILFMNRTGDFEDINLILLNSIAAKDYQLGVVKTYKNLSTPNNPLYQFTIAIAGRDYTYSMTSNDLGISAGSVLKVTLQNGAISNILEIKYPDTQASMIQAVDKDRIRVNSRTYNFTDDYLIYLYGSDGTLKTIETSQLRTDTLYGSVNIYTDISATSGGKAEMVIVRSN
jgi:hypothetical protein